MTTILELYTVGAWEMMLQKAGGFYGRPSRLFLAEGAFEGH